ncbi:hypothetical protein [Arthrobacter sp. L77]|uniref:hypothetical protein n=1 Tax=Arthrobacter sp. L77 TaxID=1496689 RepID=UPI00068D3738|nr:hypothetical protein [Arthrobacter sp. L77]
MTHQEALLPRPSAAGSSIRPPHRSPLTQHLEHFLRATTTVTTDGALVSLDELEGLYVYWCSLNGQDPAATEDVVSALEQQGVEPVTRDGVDYVEGLVLTGGLVIDFILACEFTGAWGDPSAYGPATALDTGTAC